MVQGVIELLHVVEALLDTHVHPRDAYLAPAADKPPVHEYFAPTTVRPYYQWQTRSGTGRPSRKTKTRMGTSSVAIGPVPYSLVKNSHNVDKQYLWHKVQVPHQGHHRRQERRLRSRYRLDGFPSSPLLDELPAPQVA